MIVLLASGTDNPMVMDSWAGFVGLCLGSEIQGWLFVPSLLLPDVSNNPLYSCNSSEETCKGRGRPCLCAQQMRYAVHTEKLNVSHWLIWFCQSCSSAFISRMTSIDVTATLMELKWAWSMKYSGQGVWSEQTDSSQVGYWPRLISYQWPFLCRCVVKVSDRDQDTETGNRSINSHCSDAWKDIRMT